jgi:hypothetical protein
MRSGAPGELYMLWNRLMLACRATSHFPSSKLHPPLEINSLRSTAQAIARYGLAVETVALRQQLAVYKRNQPRPKRKRPV